MSAYLVNHYKKLHEMIAAKLGHAKLASEDDNKSIEELWDEIIALFKQSGLTISEMEKLDEVLSILPSEIKERYELLIENDESLNRVISYLADKDYKSAYKQAQQLADELKVDTEFVLDENDLPVPADNKEQLKSFSDKAYIIFLDKDKGA